MNRNRRYFGLAFFVAVLLCLMCSSIAALAQSITKPAPEKWRPKDGPYGLDPGTGPTPPCEQLTLHNIELDKLSISNDEMYKCKIRKITDTATDALRIDADCDDVRSGKSKDVILPRRIDDSSFRMKWRGYREYRYVYCPDRN